MTEQKQGRTWAVHDEVPVKKMPTWEARRIMAYGEEMMLVENLFMPGDTAPEHSHPHAQITYLIYGALEFTLDGETRVLHAGDSVFMEPYVTHKAVAIEKSLLIDMFAPMREDFLD